MTQDVRQIDLPRTILIGRDLMGRVPGVLNELNLEGAATILADETTWRLAGHAVQQALQDRGVETSRYTVSEASLARCRFGVARRERFEGKHPGITWFSGRDGETPFAGYVPSEHRVKRWPHEAQSGGWCPPPCGSERPTRFYFRRERRPDAAARPTENHHKKHTAAENSDNHNSREKSARSGARAPGRRYSQNPGSAPWTPRPSPKKPRFPLSTITPITCPSPWIWCHLPFDLPGPNVPLLVFMDQMSSFWSVCTRIPLWASVDQMSSFCSLWA